MEHCIYPAGLSGVLLTVQARRAIPLSLPRFKLLLPLTPSWQPSDSIGRERAMTSVSYHIGAKACWIYILVSPRRVLPDHGESKNGAPVLVAA